MAIIRNEKFNQAGVCISAEQIDTVASTFRQETNGVLGAPRALTAAEVATYITLPAEQSNKSNIEQQAEAAITTNQTFRAIGSPTNAEVLAQVRVLSLQNIKLIRYVFNHLEDDE